MRKIFSCLFFLLMVNHFVLARNFYFSETGNDRSNGKSPRSAWRSLQRLTGLRLQSGDTLFFERGSVFEGGINLHQSGEMGKPIVITAYGTGEAPVFTGSVPATNLNTVGNNRYETKLDREVFDLFVNGLRYTHARYPNSGFLKVDKGYGKDSIASAALQEPDGYWDGALLRIRTIDWVYETRMVARYEKGLLIQGPQNRYQIEKSFQDRTKGGRLPLYNFQKGYGFFLEGLPSMVDTAFEWSWQDGKLLVQFPEGLTAAGMDIQAVVHPYGVWLNEGVKHVVVEGIHFRQYEKAGVGGAWKLSHVTIKDNRFHQIHGVGVLMDSASSNCSVSRNQFVDILGRGISALEPMGLQVEGNTLSRIGLSRGHGWTGVNGASGILIHNVERRIQTDTSFAHHNTVRYNRVDSCGYNGVRVDGHHNLVEYNVIDHCSLTLNDGANLYCFAAGPGVTHNSIFRNNIVRYSVGDSQATPDNPNLAFGIYLDNNSSEMLVEGNTVIATGASGIVNNDASFNNTIRNNTIFDCKEGLGMAEWANLGKIYGMVVDNNLVVGLSPQQKLFSLTNWIGPYLKPGIFSNNQYVNLTSTQGFYYTTKQFPAPTRLDLSFEQWQSIMDNDKGSTAITFGTEWSKGMAPKILVNDSGYPKSFLLTGEHYSIKGEPLQEKVVIDPFSSLVLFKNKKN
ncbi:right-handed parallel beta-helix repeat-containing protein [Flavihumibacter sp. RY-1]|uniref:Right-handed parallel beta-helix repeat-containing protein n=1 Tax=Flavihumibacter fluminis TaxID=2909236 RepID=A0ABS9BFU4_9BACT|nr:right-handed parallel beta-helix repeat-containing protein [Flavihumibacter fluminis]MCF1713709.1 right-handed parallel beta-helix repeat-containing protein [Flavihumibacter fluminis]